MPAAAESLSRAEVGSEAARGKGLWHRGDDENGWRSVVPWPPQKAGTGQVPGDLACGRPFRPRGRESGTGAYPGRGVDPEASSPRLPRAAEPSGRGAAARLCLKKLRLSRAPLPPGERG